MNWRDTRRRMDDALDTVTVSAQEFGVTAQRAADTMAVIQVVSIVALALAVVALIVATPRGPRT